MIPPKRIDQGQALPEYLIVAAALIALLTVPLDLVDAQGRTAAVYLSDCIMSFYYGLVFFFAIP